MSDVSVSLGANKYGKAENRVVRIYRDTPRHEIVDLNVTSQLRGAALVDSYLERRQRASWSPPTRRRTPRSRSRRSTASPRPRSTCSSSREHFVSGFDWIEGGLWQAEQYEWERILVDGQPHDHSFVRKGQGTRLATVQAIDGADARDRRGQGPHGAQVDRQRVRRLPPRPVHDTGRDATTASWRPRSPGGGGSCPKRSRPASTTTASTPRCRRCCCRPSRPCTRSRCSRPSSRWARRRSRPGPRSPRCASRCRTSTTSSTTSRRSGSTTPARSSTPPTAPTG